MYITYLKRMYLILKIDHNSEWYNQKSGRNVFVHQKLLAINN